MEEINNIPKVLEKDKWQPKDFFAKIGRSRFYCKYIWFNVTASTLQRKINLNNHNQMFHNLWLAQSLPFSNHQARTNSTLIGYAYRSPTGKPRGDT